MQRELLGEKLYLAVGGKLSGIFAYDKPLLILHFNALTKPSVRYRGVAFSALHQISLLTNFCVVLVSSITNGQVSCWFN